MTCGSVAIACVYDNPLYDTVVVSLMLYVVSFLHTTSIAHRRDNVKSLFPVFNLTRRYGYAMVMFNNKRKRYHLDTVPINIDTEVRLRGSLSATEVIGDRLSLWYDSPTGDTSDSLIYTMPCRSEAEAREIETLHRTTWGLEPVDYVALDAYRNERSNTETESIDLFG